MAISLCISMQNKIAIVGVPEKKEKIPFGLILLREKTKALTFVARA